MPVDRMLTDFGKVLPPGKVNREGTPGTRHLVDYRMPDGSGVVARPDAQPSRGMPSGRF
jgi:hypothetical protein